MADATHCDREGCDTWTRNPEDHGFLAVNWWGDWNNALTSVLAAIDASNEKRCLT